MKKLRVIDHMNELPDNDTCLKWLRDQIYPVGIKCRICRKITKHHKMSRRPCYICDRCGNHVYPAAGTIFHKSTTPLKTWFSIIYKIFTTQNSLSVGDVGSEFGLSFKTALRVLKIAREFIQVNSPQLGAQIDTQGGQPPAPRLDFYISGNISSTLASPVIQSSNPDQIKSDVPDHPAERYNYERDHDRKGDRTARLLRLQSILWQYPGGLEISRIADRCGVSERTVYRDLETLESRLGVPIWAEGQKRGIIEGHFLPPVVFNKAEAMNIFLSVRLMQNFSRLYNPSMVSTFIKLNTIVPPTLRKQIQDTLEYIDKLPHNDQKIENFNKLTEAWLSRHRVKIHYRELSGGNIEEYILEPYFIEPAVPSRSSYLIAYCPYQKSIYSLKIDLIVGDVIVEAETYEMPANFNAVDYFGSSWGIFTDEKLETVTLLFGKRMSRGVMETVWHPSQKTELQNDGSLKMTLRVRNTVDFRAWILGWGEDVKVLGPLTLKNQIRETAESIVNVYGQ